MPRYFFNIHDGVSIPDVEGTELADIEEAKHEAVRLSGQLLADNPKQFWNGEQWSLEVCDDSGLILLIMNFVATEAPVLSGRTHYRER